MAACASVRWPIARGHCGLHLIKYAVDLLDAKNLNKETPTKLLEAQQPLLLWPSMQSNQRFRKRAAPSSTYLFFVASSLRLCHTSKSSNCCLCLGHQRGHLFCRPERQAQCSKLLGAARSSHAW